MKNRYEMVIKLIDKTYKDKGNKYDTIKMLNDSVKPQCMEIIDDITKEIKNKRNNITIDKANKKVKKLFLNKEILAQKRKDINKKKLPSTIKKIGT